jgi:hypothetical protein
MASMPDQLRAALGALYHEFERYRPRGSIEHSPLKPRSVVAPLETKPLRELTADDLSAYSGSAVWTVGSSDDFKYFFPRIAELALHEIVGGSSWDSWALRLAPAMTTPSEKLAVQAFFRTLWEIANGSCGDSVQVDALELLCALPLLFEDIAPLLLVFQPCASQAAAGNLDRICNLYMRWVEKSQRSPEITAWLAESAPRALYEAFLSFPPP